MNPRGYTYFSDIDNKSAPLSQNTVYFHIAAMQFNNRLCQRQSKSNPLCIFRKTAAVKTLKNMIDILGMYATPIIFHYNL